MVSTRPRLAAVKQALSAVDSDKRPFVERPPGKAHWVEPKLVAEVSFGEWTPDGHIRHAVFHGLRDDKPAQSVVREQAAPTKAVEAAAEKESATAATPAKAAAKKKTGTSTATTTTTPTTTQASTKAAATSAPEQKGKAAKPAKASSSDATVEGIRISHPERVIDASTGITKLDVVNYYLEVSRLILPHLVKRPVSLVRAPAGIGGQLFFQKHAAALKIPDLRELDPAIAPDLEPMVEIDSFTALIGAAQANVIELHTWERDDARHDAAGPHGVRPRSRRRRELDADPGGHRADALAARAARPRQLPEGRAAARACTWSCRSRRKTTGTR